MSPTNVARTRVVIMGAAGRDFHDFNVVYRHDPGTEVVAFTATQIPGIAGRRYPAELAGPMYEAGIPIVPESELERLIRERMIDEVDMLVKGHYDRSAPERERRVSDRELAWIDALIAQDQIERRFNVGFFTAGDSRDAERAGIWGAVVRATMRRPGVDGWSRHTAHGL